MDIVSLSNRNYVTTNVTILLVIFVTCFTIFFLINATGLIYTLITYKNIYISTQIAFY